MNDLNQLHVYIYIYRSSHKYFCLITDQYATVSCKKKNPQCIAKAVATCCKFATTLLLLAVTTRMH